MLPSGRRVAMEVEGYVPYLRTGPHAACPVTLGPGTAARTAPLVRPLAPSTSDSAADAGPAASEAAGADPSDGGVAEPTVEEPPLTKAEVDLRKLATSNAHLLTHVPKNPYCEACFRAKARRSPAKRSRGPAPHREHVQKYGDEISIDHIILGPTGGSETALVLRDLATGWLDAIHLPDKTAESTYSGLRRAFGRSPIGVVHSDGAPEIARALKDLDILAEDGTPGRPNSNAIAERAVGLVGDGARVLLEQAGMPVQTWPRAARHFCLAFGTPAAGLESRPTRSGSKPPLRVRGFRSAAWLISCHRMQGRSPLTNFSNPAEPGVLVGYYQHPGGRWSGDYLAYRLSDLAKPFAEFTPNVPIHRTREVFHVAGKPCVSSQSPPRG